MAAFYFGDDSDAAWIEECGIDGDGCSLCGGKHDASNCPVFASDDEIETSSQPTATRSMADLVYEFSGEDINEIDAIAYRQLVREVQTFATPAEIERYMLDGRLPACCDDGLAYCINHPGMKVL